MLPPPVFEVDPELVRSLLTDDVFEPVEPATLDQAGLTDAFVEALICKDLSVNGTARGRTLADNVGLPFNIITRLLESLSTRKLIAHASGAQFNDYSYMLTELGAARSHQMLRECAYVGPAPVRLSEYVMSVAAQSIAHEAPGRERLVEACKGISVDPKLFRSLGPAINSGGAIFLYGAPGNGKSTLARRITMCFGQRIWVPHAIIDGGHVIKFYDTQFHKAVEDVDGTLLRSTCVDRRWIQIHRPTVAVGGELTLDSLELRHHPETKICEAPLQMKSNCGCLLIDDFGRQRIAPADLAEPLDRSAGLALRLPHASHRKKIAGAVSADRDLLDQPRSGGPGRRGISPPHSLQDPHRRSDRRRVLFPVSTVLQQVRLRVPQGRGDLSARHVLPAVQTGETTVSRTGFAGPGAEPLPLQRRSP